jgi:hypothetical protein
MSTTFMLDQMSKKVIYTSYDESPGKGNRTQCWALVEESVRAYADRCGAELINLPKPTGYQPQWVIFDAMRHTLEHGVDRALWIDCDVLIQEHASNLFDLPDRLYFCQPDPTSRVHPRMRRHWKRYGIVNPRPYIVSGLGMWSPRHVGGMVKWFDEERTRFSEMDGDQELLVVAVFEAEVPMFYFPPGTHKMTRWVSNHSSFMHAAGKDKGRKIKRFKSMAEAHKAKTRKGEGND